MVIMIFLPKKLLWDGKSKYFFNSFMMEAPIFFYFYDINIHIQI